MQGQGLGEVCVTSKLHADGSGPTVLETTRMSTHFENIPGGPKSWASSLPLRAGGYSGQGHCISQTGRVASTSSPALIYVEWAEGQASQVGPVTRPR